MRSGLLWLIIRRLSVWLPVNCAKKAGWIEVLPGVETWVPSNVVLEKINWNNATDIECLAAALCITKEIFARWKATKRLTSNQPVMSTYIVVLSARCWQLYTVFQGSAATCFRCGVKYYTAGNFMLFPDFRKNWFSFDSVTENSLAVHIFWNTVMYTVTRKKCSTKCESFKPAQNHSLQRWNLRQRLQRIHSPQYHVMDVKNDNNNQPRTTHRLLAYQ